MNNDWLILIEGKEEGPYSLRGLRAHPKVTPDTLVKKKDWKKWVAIRYVEELKDVFKDESDSPQTVNGKKILPELSQEQEVLTLRQQDPFFSYLWLLLLILLLIYLVYFFYAS